MMQIGECIGGGMLVMAVGALLSLVAYTSPWLPSGETVGQWLWFDYAALLALPVIVLGLWLGRWKPVVCFADALEWSLIVWGGVEAVWGMMQVYGHTASGHSLYAVTGSFFNPGPYSGFLSIALPVCMYRYLSGDRGRKDGKVAQVLHCLYRVVPVGSGLLILCILPAAMSRSAWLAAVFSCLWVYGQWAGWWTALRTKWIKNRRKVLVGALGICVLLLVGGCLLFMLKPESAKGRLFMWRMSGRAVMEQPWKGHGFGHFAKAYGQAQETYFAKGDYKLWEENVAGCPEYAFNEYLHVAVEAGIPALLVALAITAACFYKGMRRKRLGLCGALLALLVFAFSSYPFQLPVFAVVFCGLLLACAVGEKGITWWGMALLAAGIATLRLQADKQTEKACREWTNAKVIYNAGAYETAEKAYRELYPFLKKKAAFLFEYGHGLHRQGKYAESSGILCEALQYSNDPMVLNILGKNSQGMEQFEEAERWLLRSTNRLPGRLYPYYLLAKLYADSGYYQPKKMEYMAEMVLDKVPKVQSTAVRQMKQEMRELLGKKE